MWLEFGFTKFVLAVERRMELMSRELAKYQQFREQSGAWAVVQEGGDEGPNWASWTEGEVGVESGPWEGSWAGSPRSLWPRP